MYRKRSWRWAAGGLLLLFGMLLVGAWRRPRSAPQPLDQIVRAAGPLPLARSLVLLGAGAHDVHWIANGFFISSDGFVISTREVARQAGPLWARTYDGKVDARVLCVVADVTSELLLLRLVAPSVPPEPLVTVPLLPLSQADVPQGMLSIASLNQKTEVLLLDSHIFSQPATAPVVRLALPYSNLQLPASLTGAPILMKGSDAVVGVLHTLEAEKPARFIPISQIDPLLAIGRRQTAYSCETRKDAK